VAENEALVRGVYDELHRTQPGGFRYATLKLPDGVVWTKTKTVPIYQHVDHSHVVPLLTAALQAVVGELAGFSANELYSALTARD